MTEKHNEKVRCYNCKRLIDRSEVYESEISGELICFNCREEELFDMGTEEGWETI
jgi:hypothetical protein